MKCIRCNLHSEYRQRIDRKCPHCGGEVAFEPRDGDPISDDMFTRVLKKTSSGGSLRYCPRHVLYELCHALGTLPANFEALWQRWCDVHGEPEGVVKPWPARWDASARESDIGDYSFDRAIITDSAWMVDFLLANNFHFETSSAILSIDGYPHDRFDTIRGMLQRNPRIIVIAVHALSYEGCQLPQRLVSEDGWFREHGHVVDVGLLPEHRRLYGELARPRDEPAPDDGSGPDARWLSTHMIELEAVRPEKAMRRLFRASRIYSSLINEPWVPGRIHADPTLLGPKLSRGWV